MTHRPTIRRLTQPGTDETAAEKRPDNEQTARKPANTQPARHARVETGTASHGLATTCCATPAGDGTHEPTTKTRFHHSTTDQPTKTTYFEPRTTRPQRLTITGCAHADLRTKDPTAHTSSTRQPRTRQRRQQQQKPNNEQADQKAADTPKHQPNSCGNNDATIYRPHESRPTSNQSDMQGAIRERRPTGWRHHGEPGPPTTIPTDMTAHRSCTITQPRNLRQRTTCNPRLPEERKLDRVRRRGCAPQHASPVARASSSRLTPTENQSRWGCLQDRAYGLAPGPWRIRTLMRMSDGSLPHVSSAQRTGM